MPAPREGWPQSLQRVVQLREVRDEADVLCDREQKPPLRYLQGALNCELDPINLIAAVISEGVGSAASGN